MRNKKIKVLILHNIMAPYRFPLFRQMTRHRNINLEVWFMSKTARNRKWQLGGRKIGFRYKILPSIQFNFFTKDYLAYIINYTFPIMFFQRNFDVVISAGWLDFASQAAFLLCKLTGKKFIIWSESTKNEKSWLRTLTLPFVRFLVRHSDASIAIGSYSKEYLLSLGAKKEKIFLAYSTVDISYFMKMSKISKREKLLLRKKIGIKTSKVIIYVGQFIERKGVKYLIDAFKRLKEKYRDVSLVLLGYGPLERKIESYVQERKIQDVFFVGHVEVSNMPKMYATSDIFVLPSLEETWGLVVNEAMACGLPVIVSNKVGSSYDLVKNGINGYVFPAGNVGKLEKRIEAILREKNRSANMGRESLRLIKNFVPSAAAKNFVRAIESS